ncbi:MAG: type I glyceraldehyde-3-phosphate dehydrogenase [Bacteriovoracaceae bacterium]
MKKVRIGINGMGRIGRTILREWYSHKRDCFDLVAVNNPGNISTYAHLLKYDSLHGTFKAEVKVDGSALIVDQTKINFYTSMDPTEIPWDKDQVDIVIDCTGRFKDKPGLGKHMKGSVKKVIMCAPGKDLDGTFVMGINHNNYDPSKHNIISNASCTTNCLAPLVKVLDEKFGIENGFMTTIHAYTSDQNLLDGSHDDLRRARAAAVSMIPTSTGAAKALGEVIPAMKGKLDGYAVRVPTSDVSMVDFTVTLKNKTTKEEINKAMKEAAETYLKGVLGYTDLELVSNDFRGNPNSSIFDSKLTNVIGGNVAKVVSWYDNEVGFSSRVIDLAKFVGDKF